MTDKKRLREKKNGKAERSSRKTAPASKPAKNLKQDSGRDRKCAEDKLRESEDRFRFIVEEAIDGIMIADAKTNRQIDANKAMCAMLGYTHDEIVGLTMEDIHPKEHLPAIRNLFEKQVRGEISLAPEVPMLRKDGSVFYADINAIRMTLDGKQCVVGIFRDVTARKRADAALREREKQLAESQRIAHIGSWEHNLTTGKVVWSEELYRMLGLDPRKDPADFNIFFEGIHPDDRPLLKKAIDETVKTGKHFSIDYRFNLRDGKTRILHAQAELIPDQSGNRVILSGTGQDITEHKKREEELAVSEGRYRSLFEDSPISLWEEDITDLQAHIMTLRASGITDFGLHFANHPEEVLKCVGLVKIVSVNKATLDMYEAPDQAALLQGLSRVFTAQSLEAFRGITLALIAGAQMYECEAVTQTLQGRTINVLLRWSLLASDNTRRSRALISIVDITERQLAEEKIRKNEEFIRSILDTVDEGFIVIDRDYRILTANKAYCARVGRPSEEVIGRHCYEIAHKITRPCWDEGEECSVRQVFATGKPQTAFHKHEDRDGHVLFLETKGFPIKDGSGNIMSVIETINNITEKRLLEEERLKTQKLESIGTLAGGIAHDFNNLLQGIFGYIAMAKMTADQKEKSIAMLEQAERALHQSVNLTTQLLTFSKGGAPVKKLIDLRPVIENSVKFTLSGSRSGFSLNTPEDLWPAEADEGQLGQVIQNIVLNADQAMPIGGTVMVTAANLAANDAALLSGLAQKDYVAIAIKDTGVGIPEQYLSKIFDPYFTTKEQGSGLGLATSYSIVRNHGGIIDVRTRSGEGSTFTIYLPALAGEGRIESAVRPHEFPASARAKILLMDDEDLIRDLSSEMLRELGHDVEVAKHGQEALEKYRGAVATGSAFDIVILDLTVRGGLGGSETIQALLEIDPAVKAIVSSGYSNDETIADHLERGFKAYLKKPYSIDELRGILNSLLP